ncbi:MAG: hypothetical protein ACI4L6_00535 [Candidatus Onthoplasma sp.]
MNKFLAILGCVSLASCSILGGVQIHKSTSKDIAPAVVEEMKSEAYDKGYAEGNDIGYTTGLKNGYDNGFTSGSENGYETGYNEGLDQGHENGYNEGLEQGYENGYKVGISQISSGSVPTSIDLSSLNSWKAPNCYNLGNGDYLIAPKPDDSACGLYVYKESTDELSCIFSEGYWDSDLTIGDNGWYMTSSTTAGIVYINSSYTVSKLYSDNTAQLFDVGDYIFATTGGCDGIIIIIKSNASIVSTDFCPITEGDFMHVDNYIDYAFISSADSDYLGLYAFDKSTNEFIQLNSDKAGAFTSIDVGNCYIFTNNNDTIIKFNKTTHSVETTSTESAVYISKSYETTDYYLLYSPSATNVYIYNKSTGEIAKSVNEIPSGFGPVAVVDNYVLFKKYYDMDEFIVFKKLDMSSDTIETYSEMITGNYDIFVTLGDEVFMFSSENCEGAIGRCAGFSNMSSISDGYFEFLFEGTVKSVKVVDETYLEVRVKTSENVISIFNIGSKPHHTVILTGFEVE